MHRYQVIVQTIHDWIHQRSMQPGDRVPSVREMSSRTGFSPITVRHAYALLESDGVLEARSRSGYYVKAERRVLADFPETAWDSRAGNDRPSTEVDARRLREVLTRWNGVREESFAYHYPSRDLLPGRELYGCLTRVLRQEAHRGVASDDDVPLLREMIARRAGLRGISVGPDDVTVLPSVAAALDASLDALTRPGDLVMVESPTDLYVIACLRRRQLRVLELYSHPRSGIDAAQFEHLLDTNDVRACLLSPIYHCPTGTAGQPDTLLRIVRKAKERGAHIIESDLYGELGFGGASLRSLKAFDDGKTVLQIGSFGPTLGPRFEIAWILSRPFRGPLREQALFERAGGNKSALPHAIAQYLQTASYDRHLKRLREALEARVQRGLALISQRFPLNCSVSIPRGGYMCWVRGPLKFDALTAANAATRNGISLAPGQLFSVTAAHRNFIALNLSFGWDAEWERRLDKVGTLLAA